MKRRERLLAPFFIMFENADSHTVYLRIMLLLCAVGVMFSLFFTGTEGPLFFLSQFLLWLFFAATLLLFSRNYLLPVSFFSFLFGIFFLWLLLSLFWTPVPGYTQAMLWRQGSFFLLFIAFLQLRDHATWNLIHWFFVLLAVALSLWAIWQFLFELQPKAAFLNKNSLAGFLLPIIFWGFCVQKNWGQKSAVLILLFLGGTLLGLIGSRGAILSTVVGFLCLLALAWHGRVQFKTFVVKAAVLLLGLLSSFLLTGFATGQGIGRLASLSDPWSAGANRFIIWQSSWEMLKDAPWYGVGAGVYGLVYPQYRNYADASAGHFAHNDFLQLAIEAGWPGLLCGLLCLGVFCWLVWQGLGVRSAAEETRVELVAISAGLIAVVFHSLFTFNFYVYATLILVGVLLARAYLLLPEPSLLRKISLDDYRKVKCAVFFGCFIFLSLVSVQGISQLATEKSIALLRDDKITESFQFLNVAKGLWGNNDFNWYMEGEVFRSGLDSGLEIAAGERQYFFDQATAAFSKAFALNPFRAMTSYQWGRLLERRAATEEELTECIRLYLQALAVDPRCLPARIALAEVYARSNRVVQARALVEDGLKYHYQKTPGLVHYLELVSQYRMAAGEKEGAAALQERIRIIKAEWQGNG